MKKAMWQIGNAVPPRLAECLGYALIPYLAKVASKLNKEVSINQNLNQLDYG